MKRSLTFALALALAATGCSGDDQGSSEPGISIEATAPASVTGNTVEVVAAADGLAIVKADGDETGESGHWHVFIDSEPPAVGETIPTGKNVVHSAVSPIRIWGLGVGKHKLTVVVGDGLHQRLDVEPVVLDVEVAGPSVQASVSENIKANEKFTLSVVVDGFEIAAAAGDTDKATGHLHALVDPESPPAAGSVIPKPDDGSIVHFASESTEMDGLPPGEHTIYVVVGDGLHTAFDPLTADKVTFTVT